MYDSFQEAIHASLRTHETTDGNASFWRTCHACNAAFLQQIQERFAGQLPFIPLMSPSGNFAYRPADYDGWVYVKSTGIMTAWSFLSGRTER